MHIKKEPTSSSEEELPTPGSSTGSDIMSPVLRTPDSDLSPTSHGWSLVRGRLRKVIEEKRALTGKNPIIEDGLLYSPTENKLLNPEEIREIHERDRVRKERNRMAAQRMRERRKKYCDTLLKELSVLEGDNKTLKTEMQTLEEERKSLELILVKHLETCTNPPKDTTTLLTEVKIDTQSNDKERNNNVVDYLDLSETTVNKSPQPYSDERLDNNVHEETRISSATIEDASPLDLSLHSNQLKIQDSPLDLSVRRSISVTEDESGKRLNSSYGKNLVIPKRPRLTSL